MLRSPKEKFLVSPHKSAWEAIIMSPAFEEATFAALLQLQTELPEPVDPAKGWDSASRLAGARHFLNILTTLHKPIEKPKERTSPALNYEAGV